MTNGDPAAARFVRVDKPIVVIAPTKKKTKSRSCELPDNDEKKNKLRDKTRLDVATLIARQANRRPLLVDDVAILIRIPVNPDGRTCVKKDKTTSHANISLYRTLVCLQRPSSVPNEPRAFKFAASRPMEAGRFPTFLFKMF
jgi:hypothetical protein